MLNFAMDDLSKQANEARPVVAVSARSNWFQSIALAGTVNSVSLASTLLTAATDSTSAQAIYVADAATPGVKIFSVPPNSTYMEIGAFGDASSISTAPVLEFLRDSAVGDVPDGKWQRMPNVLGTATVTLDGAIVDLTGAAGINRYGVTEGTYQKHLFDLRGARRVAVKLITAGGAGNFSLWHRFF